MVVDGCARSKKKSSYDWQSGVQRYARDVKDHNGSKELVDLRNRNTFVKFFIMVLINVFMSVWYFC